MEVKIASELARNLIKTSRPFEEFNTWGTAGRARSMVDQFVKCSNSKKPALVPGKMRKASGGMFGRPRITSWTKDERSITLDSMTAMRKSKVYHEGVNGEAKAANEGGLLLTTIYLKAAQDDIDGTFLSGPAISYHAILRLIQREVATPVTIRSTCYMALSRVRDAVALLKDQEDPYSLMIPFGSGALCAEIRNFKPTQNPDFDPAPLLSIRTYLSEHMLRRDALNRILELEDYYAEADYSDVEKYRDILLRNKREPYISAWTALKNASYAA